MTSLGADRAHVRLIVGANVYSWIGLALLASAAGAQMRAADYARAERFLSWNAQELVVDDAPRPHWMAGDRFWYRNHSSGGYEFLVVDAATGERQPAFDHARLAAALSAAADTAYDATKLPFRDIELAGDGRAVRFSVGKGKSFTCDLTAYKCTGPDTLPVRPVHEIRSPDGKWLAFERNNNLWIRSTTTGQETALTSDGILDDGYAVNRSGCCATVTNQRNKIELPSIVLWSPDSRHLATHRFDERHVRQMALLETKAPGPVLYTYRYALPGDSVVPTYDLWIFDVATHQGVRVDRPPQQAVNTSCCWLTTDTIWKDVRWNSAGAQLYFTYGHRGFHQLDLIAADATTGAARNVLTEASPTYVELNLASGGVPDWRPLSGDREVIWFSERDGWAHLYLVDAQTGAITHRITSGAWTVGDLLTVDEATHWVYFTARGREPGTDPYFRRLYRAKLDGSEIQLLSPENADHDISVSPSGHFFLDSYSRPESPGVTVLRRADGTVVKQLQRTDISRLTASGWTPPEPFVEKARDGNTDLYGLMFRPSNFDSTKKYPIIDYIYPGPQIGPIGARTFRVAPGGEARALAELGFIVVQLDAMGTPFRSKAFHDVYYGHMEDNGIPDHVAVIKALAARHPYVDIDRVGIYGHSGGGFSSTDAMLRYPDFFKVAVSSAGNHDQRGYDYTWGEKYEGLVVHQAGGMDTYDPQANWRVAGNLKGKLMLAYGTLDDNVHPNNTLLLIDELIKHNKDYDLVVMPNRNHGFAGDPYFIRRSWDYFVKNLLGETPPAGYELKRPPT